MWFYLPAEGLAAEEMEEDFTEVPVSLVDFTEAQSKGFTEDPSA
jgi:hypothetical protein